MSDELARRIAVQLHWVAEALYKVAEQMPTIAHGLESIAFAIVIAAIIRAVFNK